MLLFLTPKILDTYEKEAGATVKDVLNRRSAHLKKDIGKNDPFETTVKGLYKKAQRQQEGPLYDVDEAGLYQRQNEGPGIGSPGEKNGDRNSHDNESASIDAPNYQEIIQRLKRRASAIKKKR